MKIAQDADMALNKNMLILLYIYIYIYISAIKQLVCVCNKNTLCKGKLILDAISHLTALIKTNPFKARITLL